MSQAKPQHSLERPVLAVDVVLLGICQGQLSVLLHHREAEPFADSWALPGVAVQTDETLVAAARRALLRRAGLTQAAIEALFLEQLATFDALFRDPRGRTVSTAYLGLQRHPGPAGAGVRWAPLRELVAGSLPFDHDHVLETALGRLRGKLRYTNIAAHLLPETFTIDALRGCYEAILDRQLNRSNFRSKLLRIGLIEQVGIDTDRIGRKGGRPPHLYRFVQRQLEASDRDFL